MTNDLSAIISGELSLPRKSVDATIRLLDDGATIPFISRYRKEATGALDEVTVHNIKLRIDALRELIKRKEYILDTIAGAGKLTPELQKRIEDTLDANTLEDIYLPYKPKRKTKASVARDKGLEPLAKIIMAQRSSDIARQAERFVNAVVASADDALNGATDIIAEWISESEKARAIIRAKYLRNATISSKVVAGKEEEAKNYQIYFKFSEPLRSCSSHRYLALRRGEAENLLKVTISIDDDEMTGRLERLFIKYDAAPECADIIRKAVRDSYKRLMRPSIETEVAALTKERADKTAIELFADNVRQLLLAPPLFNRRVLAIDPGFRTGCKVVCLDRQGNLLTHDVIFPHAPHNDYNRAATKILNLIARFNIDAIAVGTGTAGRETERFLSTLEYRQPVQIFMVNEDGASIYSASEIAREEFPDEDVTVRGAVSIGRRLIDPLAELVKIEPKSIGVGQYQHDVDQNKLKEALDYTVTSCVNTVGVNVNTSSRALLSYVSGIGPTLARNITDYRAENGNFTSRLELLRVPRLGDKAFQQCAGFLRIPDAENPLDNTGIHPEVYSIVKQMAKDLGTTVHKLIANPQIIRQLNLNNYITDSVGLPTLTDIVAELEKPGRDPRTEAEPIEYDDRITSIADLSAGMELTGKINNITAFGAFVDLGIKENGLLHISQLSDRYVSNPSDVIHLGQTVKVRILDIDMDRKRISITMKGIPQ